SARVDRYLFRRHGRAPRPLPHRRAGLGGVPVGAADPAAVGLTLTHEAGDWWIAANLMRDAAALLNTEVLPLGLLGRDAGAGRHDHRRAGSAVRPPRRPHRESGRF